MKTIFRTQRFVFAFSLLALISLMPYVSVSAKPVSAVLGIFEGSTPCSADHRAAPQISADAECEMMIWHLTLNQAQDTGSPTTFALRSSYGMSQPNTPGIKGGGVKLDLDGTWTILQGAQPNPELIIYQLNPYGEAYDKSPFNTETALFFVRLDNNLLHVLSPDKQLLVGNAAWGYTLYRTDSYTPPDPLASPVVSQPVALPAKSTGDPVLGMFEGRTPCIDLVYTFAKLEPSSSCQRIKSRLYLYQDPDTGAPTTYKYQGTRTIREGAWKITRGTAADPQALVYQLQLDDSDRFVSFLKADDNNLLLLDADLNLLIGHKTLGYTFSRAEVK